MNVNRIYVAKIYVNVMCKPTYREGRYVKTALIYRDEYDNYIDLQSGERYIAGIENTYLGAMYINLKEGLIPINEVLDISFKKQDMSKKKILKSINKAILLNKKEDDK